MKARREVPAGRPAGGLGTAKRRKAGSAPVIGPVRLGEGPCVVLAVSRAAPGLRTAAAAGVRVIEFRADGLPDPRPAAAVRMVTALRRLGLPIIATVRSAREGGLAPLSEARRAELYEALLPLCDAVDVEIASAKSLAGVLERARRLGKTILLSHHDFARTPPAPVLAGIVERGRAAGADIVKIAAMARKSDDVPRLFEFAMRRGAGDLVVIAMGPIGSISRLVLPLAGSLLTYTNVEPSVGQVPLKEFLAHLRFYYPGFPGAPAGRRAALRVASPRRRN